MANNEVNILDKDRLASERDQILVSAQQNSPKHPRAAGFDLDLEERKDLSWLRDRGYHPVISKKVHAINRVEFPSEIRQELRPIRGMIHSEEEALASVDILLPYDYFKLRADSLNDYRNQLLAAGHRDHHTSTVSPPEVEEAVYLQFYLPFLGKGTQRENFRQAKSQGLTALSLNKFEYIISKGNLDTGVLLDQVR